MEYSEMFICLLVNFKKMYKLQVVAYFEVYR